MTRITRQCLAASPSRLPSQRCKCEPLHPASVANPCCSLLPQGVAAGACHAKWDSDRSAWLYGQDYSGACCRFHPMPISLSDRFYGRAAANKLGSAGTPDLATDVRKHSMPLMPHMISTQAHRFFLHCAFSLPFSTTACQRDIDGKDHHYSCWYVQPTLPAGAKEAS